MNIQNNNFEFTSQQQNQIYDFSVKVIFIGDTNTGKTSTLAKIDDPTINTTYPGRVATIGIEFASIQKAFDDKIIKFQIWDTAGQEKYRSITASFYKNCTIAILFCDVTSIESFNSLNYWMNDLKNTAPPDIVILLVANKCDLIRFRKISYEDLESFANRYMINFIEISAENGQGVDQILDQTGKIIIERFKNNIEIPGIRVNNFIEIKTSESFCNNCSIM